MNVTICIGHNVDGVDTLTTSGIMGTLSHSLESHGVRDIGLTISDAIGFWNGEVEASTRIEAWDIDGDTVTALLSICGEMCHTLHQWEIIANVDGQIHHVTRD